LSNVIVLKKEKNNKMETSIVEARLGISGNDLFASAHAERFSQAAEMVCLALESQIKKHKAKSSQHGPSYQFVEEP
jgi:ribosome-associated translation inhibitor RaiA